MVHLVHKNVSNEVRLAHDCPKMDDGSFNQKKRNLGAYANGSWTCSNTDNSRDEECMHFSCDASNPVDDSICVDLLSGAPISPVPTTRMSVTHAAFSGRIRSFQNLDSGVKTSLGSVESAEFSVLQDSWKMKHEFLMLIRLVVDRSIWEIILRQKLHSCPESQFEMMLLVASGSLCICFLINRDRLHWCWASIFSKNIAGSWTMVRTWFNSQWQSHCLVALVCVRVRGLYSMPLFGQNVELSLVTQWQMRLPQRTIVMLKVHQQTTSAWTRMNEPSDEQISETLDTCTERSFMSEKYCRLIYQQLRNNDSRLEKNLSALMHGNNTDDRLCVFLKSVQRVFIPWPIVRQRLHHFSVAQNVNLSRSWLEQDLRTRVSSEESCCGATRPCTVFLHHLIPTWQFWWTTKR